MGRGALLSFLVLFAALYAGFGAQSPYLPALLQDRGLASQAIGAVLAGGTAIRLLSAPVAGRVADSLGATKPVFAGCAAAAALAGIGFLPAGGLWFLLAVALCQAAVLAPLAPLADTLALGTAAPGQPLHYGWIRGAGSAAFIAGSVGAGQIVGHYGTGAIVWLGGALLIAAAIATAPASQVPPHPTEPRPVQPGTVLALLRLSRFRRVVLVAALVLGSHALHDGFAVIRWRAAGIEPGAAGLLWAEAVAGEVLVFLVIGRPVVDRLGPAGAAAVAAGAGILRWSVEGATASLPAMIAIQPLHGLTFALLHLANMRLLAETVPPRLAATALTLYGTVGVGAASAVLSLASGALYADIGPHGFWVMAVLCGLALPLARGLTQRSGAT